MEPAMTWLSEAPMPTALDVGEEKIQLVQTAQRPPRRGCFGLNGGVRLGRSLHRSIVIGRTHGASNAVGGRVRTRRGSATPCGSFRASRCDRLVLSLIHI